MEEIITRLTTEMVKNICEKAFCSKWQGLADLAGDVKEICMTTGREVLEECIRSINQTFRENKARRKELGLVLHEKERPRKILTEMGMIDISRDYYQDKKSGKYVYPLDELLEVKRYERIDSRVRATLVWEACEQSYQRSTEHVTEGAVSRQTVRNAILRCDTEIEIPNPKKKRAVKELHIHADEDHVHMQKSHKQKGKKNQIVPLVTVTEGSRRISASRNETINPVHFVDEAFDTKKLWTSVGGYLLKTYEMESLEKIYIHADGGSWIRNGLSDFRNVIMVMDEYHSEKELRSINKLFSKRNVSRRFRQALHKDDFESATKIIDSLKDNSQDEKTTKVLTEFSAYLKNNRDALVSRYKGNLPGSCTEGQVSHVLSKRFSRNPMGWSEEVLGKLSKIRIYKINGGNRTEVIKSRSQNSSYAAYYKDSLFGHLEEKLDWSIFEKSPSVFDTNSGTQRLIRMFGQAR